MSVEGRFDKEQPRTDHSSMDLQQFNTDAPEVEVIP